MTFQLQTKTLFSPSTDSHDSVLEDSILNSFSKSPILENLSLDYIKKQEKKNRHSIYLKTFAVLWTSLVLFLSCTHLLLLLFQILFTKGFILEFSLPLFFTSLFCGLGVFHVSLNFLSKIKWFNLNKERDNIQTLITQFLKMNHNKFIHNLKDKLYQDLDNKHIQQSQPSLYSYFKESISNLDNDYQVLLYQLETQLFIQEYHFQSFQTFINKYNKLCANITMIDDIKILNEI